MGENDKLGFTCEEVPFDFSTFNRFFGATTPYVEDESWNGNPCGRLTVADTDLIQRNARLKSEQECIAEKYKPIADKLVEEICESSQKPIDSFSEIAAQQIGKEFDDMLKTLDKNLPIALKSAKRKHYKPKFTL